MTIEQLEFDFMKKSPVGFDHEYHHVCLTSGWNGVTIKGPARVTSAEEAAEFIKKVAPGIRGYCDTWTITDVPEHQCVVIDFGSYTYFGRVDYV